MSTIIPDDEPFCSCHIENVEDVGGERLVLAIYDNHACDLRTGADRLFPMPIHHARYEPAWVAMRSAAWPAKISPSSSFGYPGDDRYSEYWRDDWGRRFLIEKDGMRDCWTMREVAL